MPLTLPPDTIIESIHGPVTRVTRRIDIYQPDAETLWRSDVGLVSGSVDIDATRDERRSCDLVLDNENNLLQPRAHEDYFWYDKVIKVYRGVITAEGAAWEYQQGEFRIDGFRQRHSSDQMTIKCRDNTKLLQSKFSTSTIFPINHPIEEVVRAIAVAGGLPVSKINLPLTGESTSREYVFEQEQDRWAAIKEVSVAYSYEVFFDNEGFLTMRPHQDPFLTPASYSFQTGPDSGNLVDYDKDATDARLRNHIVATGESATEESPPVWAEVANENPNSPTSIQRLGKRSEFYKSSLIESYPQAVDVANRFLQVMALEQFDVDMSAIVVPYIDAGIIVEFLDPDPAPGDPTKYLLQSVTVPLKLEPMKAKAGRVINLGV